MSVRTSRAAAALALALSLASASARGQDAGAPRPIAPEVEARALFEQGVSLSAEERWGEALEAFRRSRVLVERPSTVFNIAVALLRLGQPTAALAAIDDFMRIADPRQEAARLAEAARMRELATTALARLSLTVEPAQSTVTIDEVAIEGSGATRELTVDPGRHRVDVAAEGHRATSVVVSLMPGETRSEVIRLEPLPGRIELRSDVAATIRVDGAIVGTGRAYTGEVAPGRHHIELRAPDHLPFDRDVEVQAGETLAITADLRAEPPALFERPIFWILAGAAALAAGVTIGIVAASGTDDPYPGSTGVVIEALGL